MAKSSRPPVAPTPVALETADDPLENAVLWLQANARTVGIGLAVVLVAGAGVWGIRASDAKKRANASTALYAAQAPLYEGKTDVAQKALDDVVKRYGKTSAGEQAVLLLAQTYFDSGQYATGISQLESAASGASAAFAAPMQALLAAGYEGAGDFAKAATAYAAAATKAASETERDGFVLAQARALLMGGDSSAAAALFEKLQADQGSAYAQEAAVRLGELLAKGSNG